MRARALSGDYGQELATGNGKPERELVAERILDSLLATNRYHSAEGVLEVDRLIRDVRAIETALILTRRAK